ncbi:DEAD/DEAH box helicase [Paracoccus liaowanqingii]|nr:DEAD/DEAH box helicase [Paracoccus liaowanqingii]
MLDAPAPVRIFSAPTGAGKSYAFQVAMRKRGARILFIVPTRRLAQNLAEGLRQDLVDAGMTEDRVLERVGLWTSDEGRRIRAEDPKADVNRHRIREIRMEASLPQEGLMIIATPESVAHYLLRPAFTQGGADVQSIVDLLRLDHVVFDEFHTIEARGMGLSMAIATFLAQDATEAKLTFLSATPIDLVTSFVHFGIPRESILVEAEMVVTGGPEETVGMRAIHGDVTVTFRRDGSMVEALEACRQDILETLSRPSDSKAGQVVLIFDSVRDLQTSKQELAAWFDGIGIGRAERLAISSVDDSTNLDLKGLFMVGRAADPLKFRVLIATASVEMGVTFRAGMILMNPGHDPCSFVQRIGRVARGDMDGQVVVTSFRSEKSELGWFSHIRRQLLTEAPVVPVDRFIDCVLDATRARFDVTERDLDQVDGTFRKMPQSAAWAAALFWCAMEEALVKRGYKGIRNTLRNYRPKKAGAMSAWLGDLGKISLHSAQKWRQAFLREALRLRMISPAVSLVDPDGNRRNVPWHIWASDERLSNMPSRPLDDGRIEVAISTSLEQALSDLSYDRRVRRREEILLPHVGETPLLEADRLVESCLTILRRAEKDHLRAEHRTAREIGERLIRLTRIVPTVERTIDSVNSNDILRSCCTG